MEIAKAETKPAAEAPTRPRRRFQYSLGTLIWMTIAAGAVVLWALSYRETVALREESQGLREENKKLWTRITPLKISDTSKIHVIATEALEDKTWRWRVYLPPGQFYTMHGGTELPSTTGLSQRRSAVQVPLHVGEIELEAGLRRSAKNEWELVLTEARYATSRLGKTDRGRGSASKAIASWMQNGGYSWYRAGDTCTETFAQDEHIPLLRFSPCAKNALPSSLTIWIEQDDPKTSTAKN